MKFSLCSPAAALTVLRPSVFPSVLVAALALSAALPAKAQWTRGNTYYGVTFVANASSRTTVTKTADAGTANIALNSVPIQPSGYDTSGYTATGNLYGYVYQDFVWGGQGPTGLMYRSAESVSGSCTIGKSASSSLDHTSGATSTPYTLSYSASSPLAGGGASFYGFPPTTYTAKEWMSATTYASGTPSSATASATVVYSVYSF